MQTVWSPHLLNDEIDNNHKITELQPFAQLQPGQPLPQIIETTAAQPPPELDHTLST